MPKKGKGKGPAFLDTPEALAPFEVSVRDIIKTPLGVQATVVGVKEGALWLQWPGGIISPASPAPQKAKTKAELDTLWDSLNGYVWVAQLPRRHLSRSEARAVAEGGRVVVLAYHSLEDRRVKRFFRDGKFRGDAARDAYGNRLTPFRPLTRKAETASDEEVAANPRARSARLRVAERTDWSPS